MRALVVCKHAKNSDEVKACAFIAKNGFDIKYSWKNVLRPNDLEGADLVISIGGDGTALSASHFLTKRPLLAVNSNPKQSEGALTTISLNELDHKLESIKSGKFKTEKLERIEVLINGVLQNPLALNDVFIANEKAYYMSKYAIQFNGAKEEQKSSGLIFSTGTGSTAWFKSAGGTPFSAQARVVKMIVREPFLRRISKFKTTTATIGENDSFEVTALTPMVLAIDSIRELKLATNDVVKIRISDKFLERIV